MDIATFSTHDLREQGRKSYVASYRANEKLVITRMFSRELRRVIREIFLPRTIPNIRYIQMHVHKLHTNALANSYLLMFLQLTLK